MSAMAEMGGGTARPQPWGVLALMFALSLLSLIDRLILALLVRPLQADLGISDVQLGLLFGTAFAFFYAIMGLPLARVADKHNRVRLVWIAVVLWSLCTILSGFASSFWELLVLRAGLALGEAALMPTVHSLIFDLFDKRRRPLAATIFMISPPLGGALAYILGGPLIAALEIFVADGGGWGFRSWQLVFFSVGLPSLLLGILFGLVVREPERHARKAEGASLAVAKGLGKRRNMFFWLIMAGGVCQCVPYAYQAWAPTLLIEKYGLSMAQTGLSFGLASAAGAVLGGLAVPLIAVRLFDQGRLAGLTLVPLIATIFGATVYALAPLQGSATIMLVSIALGHFGFLGANATIFVAMQRLAPDHLRATLIAATLLIASGVGLGIGPVLTAYVANALGSPPRYDLAMSALSVLIGVLGAVLFVIATRSVLRHGKTESVAAV